MLTKQLTWGKGYSGKTGNKCWVAQIDGKDNKFGLSRSFVEADTVEREHFNRSRTTITFTYELPVGLYEISQHGERSYCIVWTDNRGTYKAFTPTDDRVKEMVNLMDDDDLSADEARIATSNNASIAYNEEQLAQSLAKDPEGTITLNGDLGTLCEGETVTRERVIEERRAIIASLRAAQAVIE